jgi:nucleoside diphosphate kinase
MLRHSHAEGFRKATQMKYEAIENRDIWQIVDRFKNENQQIISLKWVFTYKTDSNDYLIKYKTRIVIKNDLQMIDSQDVYAITLASKMFRVLMTLITAFNLKTRQLNAINAFFNAHNDELIYCQMSNDYRLDEKVIKIIRALYEQRKSSLLWLRMLIAKCLEMRLRSISRESCLFINRDEIFMFFYVDDIVFAYRVDKKHATKLLISKLKDTFEMRDLDTLKFFLRVRIIQQSEMIYLVQDAYAEKLIKEYEIFINQKIFISLSYQSLISYENEIDSDRVHVYRQKVRSICYLVIIIRSNMIKVAFKLAEFLINLDFYHLIAIDHCIRYMHSIRHLVIKFDVSKDEELIIQIDINSNAINQIDFISNKHVFETSMNAFFANEQDRRSGERYTFKLFDDLIDWTARKQVTISTSIIEAELLAMLHAGKEFIWWIHLFEKLRFDLDQKMIIYNDNLQIIRLLISKIVKMNTKLRHVDIAQCWLRQSIQLEKIDVEYLSTAHMMIDEMIKLLFSQRHKQFIDQLRLMNVKSLMNDEISR